MEGRLNRCWLTSEEAGASALLTVDSLVCGTQQLGDAAMTSLSSARFQSPGRVQAATEGFPGEYR